LNRGALFLVAFATSLASARVLAAEAPFHAPASSIFVEAVEKVVKRWVYTMPVGSDCMPSTEPV